MKKEVSEITRILIDKYITKRGAIGPWGISSMPIKKFQHIVIIPAYAELEYIGQTLDSLSQCEVDSFDSKRALYGWKEVTTNKYAAHNSGLATQLFVDGEDLGRSGELENYCLGTTYFCEVLPNPIPMYAICLDMVADKDPSFPVESFSWMQAPDLVLEVWSLAKQLGYEEFKMNIVAPIYDDHRALTLNSGIPAIDIIDFDYPFWHTLDDTPSNCSAETLKIVGNVVCEFIYRKDYESK